MKRTLTSSERRLFFMCAVVVLSVVAFFLSRDHRTRLAGARQKIEDYQSRFGAAVAAAGDAPFWRERQAWLDANLPSLPDEGQAHSAFLEDLERAARERGLTITSPVLLKPEAGPNHRELPISMQVAGPDAAVFRWLADLQTPEKPHLIKHLVVASTSATPPRLTSNITVARLFKP